MKLIATLLMLAYLLLGFFFVNFFALLISFWKSISSIDYPKAILIASMVYLNMLFAAIIIDRIARLMKLNSISTTYPVNIEAYSRRRFTIDSFGIILLAAASGFLIHGVSSLTLINSIMVVELINVPLIIALLISGGNWITRNQRKESLIHNFSPAIISRGPLIFSGVFFLLWIAFASSGQLS